jgi:hypothetical protein
VGAGEEQAVDNPPYNDIIRSDSLEIDEHASGMRVVLWTQYHNSGLLIMQRQIAALTEVPIKADLILVLRLDLSS